MRIGALVFALCVMADLLTGADPNDDRTQDVLDYLGRRAPLSFSHQPALPAVGAPGPAAGPTGPSGMGVTPTDTAGGAATSGGEVAAGPDSAGTALSIAREAIGGAKTATQALSDTTQGTQPQRPDLSSLSASDQAFLSDVGFGPGGFLESEAGVQPAGEVSGLAGAASAGLGGAGLAALVAQLAESGKITPGQAAGLLQSAGATSTGLASTLGPTQAGQTGTALSGTIGPEAAGLLGTAGEVVGGAGALASIGLTLSDAFKAIHNAEEDPRQYATAGGAGVGLGAGALLGTAVLPGYGTLVGAGVGGAAGDAIGQAIARNLPPTHYMALRQHWGEVAADAVNAYGFGIQKAASNGGLPEIQQAMSQRYADGHVAASLALPDYVAAAIGAPTTASFDTLTTPQFLMLLKAASQTDPSEYERWVTASGDVEFLEQGRAQGVADATRGTAVATMGALIQTFQPILDQMAPVAPDAIEASRVYALGAPERQADFLATQGPYRGATE
jgi:hypothetical protein